MAEITGIFTEPGNSDWLPSDEQLAEAYEAMQRHIAEVGRAAVIDEMAAVGAEDFDGLFGPDDASLITPNRAERRRRVRDRRRFKTGGR
jgi:hypothetical protein